MPGGPDSQIALLLPLAGPEQFDEEDEEVIILKGLYKQFIKPSPRPPPPSKSSSISITSSLVMTCSICCDVSTLRHVQHHLRHVQDEAEMADDEDEVEEDEEIEDEEIKDEMGEMEDEAVEDEDM